MGSGGQGGVLDLFWLQPPRLQVKKKSSSLTQSMRARCWPGFIHA